MVSEEVAQQIDRAVAVLKEGGVVVFPTETAYGLAADARNRKAVGKLCRIKGRTPESLPIIAANRGMAESVGIISGALAKLADKHWPGPLTIIVQAIPGALTSGILKNGRIAVRVSSHEIAKALSQGLGAPIVSTSANVAGWPTGYSVEDVKEQFKHREHQPDMYFDVGPLDASVLPSTIVTVGDHGYLEVIRQGSIEIHQ